MATKNYRKHLTIFKPHERGQDNMSIVKTMTQSDFQDELKGEYFNFSYDGTKALYDYYEELSESSEEPFEFDAIAIRCEWSEYDSLQEFNIEYWGEGKNDNHFSIDELGDETQAIELDNGHVLVSEF